MKDRGDDRRRAETPQELARRALEVAKKADKSRRPEETRKDRR
jgi:hypothetical protein